MSRRIGSDRGAEIVLSGRDHNYERLSPTDPNGNVLAPRQQRMADILTHAQALGKIDANADVAGAVGVAIGAAYVAHVSGSIPDDWPQRTAALVWRAVGGK